MLIQDKIILKFKDLNNNIYEIRQKTNRNYYLTIKKYGKKSAIIFNGSKQKIFNKLQEIHKNTKFINL